MQPNLISEIGFVKSRRMVSPASEFLRLSMVYVAKH